MSTDLPLNLLIFNGYQVAARHVQGTVVLSLIEVTNVSDNCVTGAFVVQVVVLERKISFILKPKWYRSIDVLRVLPVIVIRTIL